VGVGEDFGAQFLPGFEDEAIDVGQRTPL
jgi:hypothetical protein